MTADATQPDMSDRSQPVDALDQAVLEELRLDLEDEDGTAVAGLVNLYLDSARVLIPDLTAALRSGDQASAARSAHALASPSALIGAVPLGALLQAVQVDTQHSGNPSAGPAGLADAIDQESGRVIAALARLDSTGSTEPASAG